MEQGQLLTVTEAARMLNVSRTTMYRLLGNGEIKSVRVGARQRIPPDQINDFIARQMQRVEDYAADVAAQLEE